MKYLMFKKESNDCLGLIEIEQGVTSVIKKNADDTRNGLEAMVEQLNRRDEGLTTVKEGYKLPGLPGRMTSKQIMAVPTTTVKYDMSILDDVMLLRVPMNHKTLVTPQGVRYVAHKKNYSSWNAEDKAGIRNSIPVENFKTALKLSMKKKAVLKNVKLLDSTMSEIFGVKTLKPRTYWKTLTGVVFNREGIDISGDLLRKEFTKWCKANGKVVPKSNFRGKTDGIK